MIILCPTSKKSSCLHLHEFILWHKIMERGWGLKVTLELLKPLLIFPFQCWNRMLLCILWLILRTSFHYYSVTQLVLYIQARYNLLHHKWNGYYFFIVIQRSKRPIRPGGQVAYPSCIFFLEICSSGCMYILLLYSANWTSRLNVHYMFSIFQICLVMPVIMI